jgi:hypothetical protein
VQAWTSLAGLADRVRESLEDDFNTAQGIGQVFETVRALNVFLSEHGDEPSSFTDLLARMARLTFEGIGEVLGVPQRPQAFLRGERRRSRRRIEQLIAELNAARRPRLRPGRRDPGRPGGARDPAGGRAEGTAWKVAGGPAAQSGRSLNRASPGCAPRPRASSMSCSSSRSQGRSAIRSPRGEDGGACVRRPVLLLHGHYCSASLTVLRDRFIRDGWPRTARSCWICP